jgi:hypothetical protein
LQAAANPPAPEISFGAALAEIAATQSAITGLTQQLTAETATLRGQEDALRSLQAQQDMLRESAAALQSQITMAEAQQKLMNDALVAAVLWMLEGSDKAKKFGGVISEQAVVLDTATKKLLETFFNFSDEHSGTTITDVNAVVSAWEAAKSRIDELAGQIRANTGGIGAPNIETHAYGGVAGGGLSLVGERGAELLNLPRGTTVTPLSSIAPTAGASITPLAASGARVAGATIVNVYVGGSVVAERDLALAVRDELVRLQGRNRTTGLV